MGFFTTTLLILAAIYFISGIRIIYQYERGVKFTLGRYSGLMGPGLRYIFPVIQTMVKVDMRVVTIDVPKQEVMTKDNVPTKINAVVYFRVKDADKAVIEIEDYEFAISQLSQTTLRDVIGKVELDEVLAERDKLAKQITKIVDDLTDKWGIDIVAIEIKDVELPESMKRAMASQAEAERDRRARITLAEGELQASRKLAEAAKVMEENPASLHLRFLQTASEIASENNSTIILPIPVELLNFFKKKERTG